MADDALLLQTLQRMESKLDAAIMNHGERIAKTETAVEAHEKRMDTAENRQWLHSLVVTLLGTPLGLLLRRAGLIL
jgi:hypothetical protein